MHQRPPSHIYEIEDLVVKREKGDSAFTLHVSKLNIRAGEFVGVVGDSGCGKSTLLDVLGLVLRPHRVRSFRFYGTDEKGADLGLECGERELASVRRTQLGYVLQTGGLLPFLTVRGNIELSRRMNGMKRNDQASKYLARLLGIESQLNKHPHHLSGGQRQRVAIARALAHNPPVLLADEPTASVDGHTAREIMSHLQMLSRGFGVTLMVVTHDHRLVEQIADRLITFDVWPSNKGIQARCHEAYHIT